jgi:hypothetical protein
MGAATFARAGSMDPTVDRFVTNPQNFPKLTINGHAVTCQDLAANPALFSHFNITNVSAGQYACAPVNAAFHNLVTEYGFAIAPDAFHPARTTGFGGFAFTVEAAYTKINSDSSAGGIQYWHLGTQGNVDPNTGNFANQNTSPDSRRAKASLSASSSRATSVTSRTRHFGSPEPIFGGLSSKAFVLASSA